MSYNCVYTYQRCQGECGDVGWGAHGIGIAASRQFSGHGSALPHERRAADRCTTTRGRWLRRSALAAVAPRVTNPPATVFGSPVEHRNRQAVGVGAELTEVDVAIVGAGGAGLSLLLALERTARRAGVRPPTIAVFDPVRRREPDRTWCWWMPADAATDPASSSADLDRLLTRSWSRLELVDRAGAASEYDLGALRYVMLRSDTFYAAAEAAMQRLAAVGATGRPGRSGPGGQAGVLRFDEPVDGVDDGPEVAVVRAGSVRLRARWVFDSRPAAPRRPGSTMLLQHFRGWTVRFDRPRLDPELATLMDFQVRQPARGVAFGYCLPLDDRRALVEYTEFSRERLPAADYDRALGAYLRQRWDVEPGRGVEVEAVEDGVIPMTDASFAGRVGARVFRLGTAGGATRASTGYTFATMNRQADLVAGLLVAGRTPVPPTPYPARHRWMDAVLLRALDQGYVRGPELFTEMFARNPSDRVVRFLDGRSGPLDELALMRTTPMPAMLRATIEDAAARARRRWQTPGR
jgi:lycopene beta-cyclase